jgi:hypothetical protein
MTEQWKKEMQQKMADYRESDIEVSWAEIEKALAANGKQAKVVPLWTKRVAAAAVVLLIVGGGYWMTNHQRTETGKQTEQPQMASVPQQQEEKSQKPETTQDIQDRITQKIQKVRAQGLISLFTADKAASDTFMTSTETEMVAPAEVASTEEATKEAPAPADTVFFPKYTPTQHQHTIYPSDLRKRTSSLNRLTAKVYLSNTMASSSNFTSSTYQKLQIEFGEIPHGNEGGEDKGGKDGVSGHDGKDGPAGNSSDEDVVEVYKFYKTFQISERVHHHQPIRFGFSLRYWLDERWSIESGLTYTRLSADITNTVDGQATATEQRLNYIGIPLHVSYLMWGNRYFNFYLSAGGLAEKMVKGNRTTNGENNSVSIHPLQVSVNGAAGAEFKFTDGLSLYAEPSLNYYFDNGSSIPTLYQEKPLNFNLNVGIRFDLK